MRKTLLITIIVAFMGSGLGSGVMCHVPSAPWATLGESKTPQTTKEEKAEEKKAETSCSSQGRSSDFPRLALVSIINMERDRPLCSSIPVCLFYVVRYMYCSLPFTGNTEMRRKYMQFLGLVVPDRG